MLIEVEEAWRLIDAFSRPLPAGRTALRDALDLRLAEAAIADRDHPPFDRSTVDGYAISMDDSSTSFKVVRTIAPGESCRIALDLGCAIRLFTGAELPASNLRVVMQEDTVREGDTLRIKNDCPGRNICHQGEDFRAGAVLIPAGTAVDAVASAMLASIGQAHPLVIRPPRILHFTSGDEIVDAEKTPGPGKIRNSNAPLIRALLSRYRPEEFRQVHLPDNESQASRLIAEADPDRFDVLLFSGGASVGDYDFTRSLLRTLGHTIHFPAVNVRPGKPLIFASRGENLAFGIPGNPVSHFVCFHLFIARALDKLAGREPASEQDAELASPIPGKPNRRVTYWPAIQSRDGTHCRVSPVPWNSSGHLASLLGVNALIRLDAEAKLPAPDEIVRILPLQTSP
ncbi:MAG: molybdopterin molybdotransferase MoeA [Terrimicrobiaceae bacterium]|nr:molybdopterin molybdotransferase MoeA [Terrimicrobiaceae bacterium]